MAIHILQYCAGYCFTRSIALHVPNIPTTFSTPIPIPTQPVTDCNHEPFYLASISPSDGDYYIMKLITTIPSVVLCVAPGLVRAAFSLPRRAIKSRRGGVPAPLGAVSVPREYDIPGLSASQRAQLVAAHPLSTGRPDRDRESEDLTDSDIVKLRLASATVVEDPGTLLVEAPAFVAAILPHRLRDVGPTVFTAVETATYERAGIALWIPCLLYGPSEDHPDRCDSLADFTAASALAKALVVKVRADSLLERVWHHLVHRPFASEAEREKYGAFTALPLDVIHASIVAAGPLGIPHAVNFPSTIGTKTFFPYLTAEEEIRVSRFLPAGDRRWEDLPMCLFLTALLVPTAIELMHREAGLTLRDQAVEARVWDAVNAGVDTTTANDDLRTFLGYSHFASGIWVKRSLCPLPPSERVDLLRGLEPPGDRETTISEDQVSVSCSSSRAMISQHIHNMVKAGNAQPITAGLRHLAMSSSLAK